jgi:hypothetical protein
MKINKVKQFLENEIKLSKRDGMPMTAANLEKTYLLIQDLEADNLRLTNLIRLWLQGEELHWSCLNKDCPDYETLVKETKQIIGKSR